MLGMYDSMLGMYESMLRMYDSVIHVRFHVRDVWFYVRDVWFYVKKPGHAVSQLVGALRYKSEGCWWIKRAEKKKTKNIKFIIIIIWHTTSILRLEGTRNKIDYKRCGHIYENYYSFETQFFLMFSPAREIQDVSSALEFSNLLLLEVPSLYSRLTCAFCYVILFSFRWILFCVRVVIYCPWNVMAQTQKPDFVFRRNGRVHLNRRGRQFSRILAAEVCASAVVKLDTPCSEVVWRVLATHSIRQFPLHFPSRASPCAIIFQLDSTCVYCIIRVCQKSGRVN